MPPVEAGGRGRRLLSGNTSPDKALSQLPGVVDHLTAPIQAGDLYSRPSQQARAAGSEAAPRPDAVVRDAARLYPKDPRASAPGRRPRGRGCGTRKRPPPGRMKTGQRPDGAREALEDADDCTRNWTSSNHGHAFGQTRCALCDPIAKDERGRRSMPLTAPARGLDGMRRRI